MQEVGGGRRPSRRDRQAAQTRRDVVAAATELFGEVGWTATTIAAVAQRADVSPETIYKAFGSKKMLLKAALDVSLAGDDEPVSVAARLDEEALSTGPIHDRVRALVEFTVDVHARTSGLWHSVVEAAASDPDVEALRSATERARRDDARNALVHVLGRDAEDQLVDITWLLCDPQVYSKLTRDLGFGRHDCIATLTAALDAVITGSRPVDDPT